MDKSCSYCAAGGSPFLSKLLKTLEQGLGDAFTPPVKAAWAEVYNIMAGIMMSAAKSEEGGERR